MNLQFLNKANQYVIVMFKYLQTKSNRFVNDLKTKKTIENTFVQVSGGGRMAIVREGKFTKNTNSVTLCKTNFGPKKLI